jgi:hypothetical protein
MIPGCDCDTIYAPIDPEIRLLCAVIRAQGGLSTISSCSGHNRQNPYITLFADGLVPFKRLVTALNLAEKAVRKTHPGSFAKLSVIVSDEIMGASDWLDGGSHDWIGLELTFAQTRYEQLTAWTLALRKTLRQTNVKSRPTVVTSNRMGLQRR